MPESLACGFLDPCLVGAWCSERTAFSKGAFIRRGVRRLGCSNVGSHWFFSSCSTTCHFLCQGLWPSFFCFSFSEAEITQKISCEWWEEQRLHTSLLSVFSGFLCTLMCRREENWIYSQLQMRKATSVSSTLVVPMYQLQWTHISEQVTFKNSAIGFMSLGFFSAHNCTLGNCFPAPLNPKP